MRLRITLLTLLLSALFLSANFSLKTKELVVFGSEEDTASDEAATRREEIQKSREERKLEFEKKKLEREAEREKKKEELKLRLAEIRSESKKKAVERINENLERINSKWIEQWNRKINRLIAILDKIKARTAEAKSAGKDTTLVEAAIAKAETAIADAQAAINAQLGKGYTFEVLPDDKLGPNVSDTVHEFKSDLKGVIAKVRAAKDAVKEAFKALKRLVGDDAPAATTTGSGVPTGTPTSSASPTGTGTSTPTATPTATSTATVAPTGTP